MKQLLKFLFFWGLSTLILLGLEAIGVLFGYRLVIGLLLIVVLAYFAAVIRKMTDTYPVVNDATFCNISDFTVQVGDIVDFNTGVSVGVKDIYQDKDGEWVASLIWYNRGLQPENGTEMMADIELWFHDTKIVATLSAGKLDL